MTPLARPRRHGFTLVELLIVVAIVAIVVTMAMPSFARQSVDLSAQARAATLQSSLQSALMAALQSGRPVSLRATGDDFARGWTLFRDDDGDGVVDPRETVLDRVDADDALGMTLVASSTAFTYDGRGRPLHEQPFEARVCVARDGAASAWHVTVARTGSIASRPRPASTC